MNITFRGQPAEIVERRIPSEERDREHFYYDIRHTDTNLDMPATVENCVVVNYWGTLVTTEPIAAIENQPVANGCIHLTRKERRLLKGWTE